MTKGVRYRGIAAVERPDSSGETLSVAGADIRRLPGAQVTMSFGRPIGTVLEAHKVEFGANSALVPEQLRGFGHLVGHVPYIAVEVLVTDPDTLRFLESGRLGFGVSGYVTAKAGKDESVLRECVLNGVAMTDSPVDPAQWAKKAE